MKLAEILRPVTVQLESIKKLTFSDTLIVDATLINQAQKDFKKCLVTTSIIKDTAQTGYKYYLNQLKPIDNQSILVNETLTKEGTLDYRVVFDNYNYEGNVTAMIHAECY